MLTKFLQPFSVCARHHHVTVLGGASDIGQTISLLLRGQTNITELVIHDTKAETPGVILDVSHIPSKTAVKGFVGEGLLDSATKKAEIIIAAGGLQQEPGLSEGVRLDANIKFVKSFAKSIARLRPMPFVGIITDPINSLVPLAAEILKQHGNYDPRKLFGITGVNALRAQTLFAADHKLDPSHISIPVIGGDSPQTCLPLLSQMQPAMEITEHKAEDFTLRFRSLDEDITLAKRGFSPALSIAHSAVLFTRLILDAIDGRKVSVNGLVEINDFGTEFFSGLIHLDQDGVKDMQRYQDLSKYEIYLLEAIIDKLRRDVEFGKSVTRTLKHEK